MRYLALLPAAGNGARFGGGKPKQYSTIGGKTLLQHSIERLAAGVPLARTYVALSDHDAWFEGEVAAGAGVTALRCGGSTRAETVANTLREIEAAPDDWILVHDAVRPFVTPEQLDRVIKEARKRGAAILGIPAIDTVKEVKRATLPEDMALITTTIPRERIVLAQTPQVFSYSLLRDAFRKAQTDGVLASDESALVERFGHEVFVVLGSERNFKITRPADMDLARFYLEQERKAAR